LKSEPRTPDDPINRTRRLKPMAGLVRIKRSTTQ
jgi:hypothetical protein